MLVKVEKFRSWEKVPNMSDPSADFIPKPDETGKLANQQQTPNNGNFPTSSNVSDSSTTQNSAKVPLSSATNHDPRKAARPLNQPIASNNNGIASNAQNKSASGRKVR